MNVVVQQFLGVMVDYCFCLSVLALIPFLVGFEVGPWCNNGQVCNSVGLNAVPVMGNLVKSQSSFTIRPLSKALNPSCSRDHLNLLLIYMLLWIKVSAK